MKSSRMFCIAVCIALSGMMMSGYRGYSESTEKRLWKWTHEHYNEMLDYCFPMKLKSTNSYNDISFRFYSSLHGVCVQEYAFYIYDLPNDDCRVVFRHTKGGGLCAQIAQQIEEKGIGKSQSMIRNIQIEEHSLSSQQCPSIKEVYKSLKKVKVSLYEEELRLDPPQYEFYYAQTGREYTSSNPNEEISKIAVSAYQDMVKCYGSIEN